MKANEQEETKKERKHTHRQPDKRLPTPRAALCLLTYLYLL